MPLNDAWDHTREERNMLCTYFILFYFIYFSSLCIIIYEFQNPILAEKETIIILFGKIIIPSKFDVWINIRVTAF